MDFENSQIVSHNQVVEYFSDLPDPRMDRTKKHQLMDILFISLCAVLAGADGFVEIADFAEARLEWFRQYLDLPNGTPSHDTFARVFARLDPIAFSNCFVKWMKALHETADGDVIPIDGKTLCHSFDTAMGNNAIHMVSAFAHRSKLVLAQVKVSEKSNEITAIPKLLDMLDLEGCIVTIDAMGTQKAIARQIISADADYILALKGNHSNLHADVEAELDRAIMENWRDAQDQPIKHTRVESRNYDHGRAETRTCWAMECPEWVHDYKRWDGLRSIAVVETKRDGTTHERRYYISSLAPVAKIIANAVRAHWSIENNLHWALDVTFNEDDSRIRKDNAPENMAIIRHIALNLLKTAHLTERTRPVSLNRKRHLAGWNPTFLGQVVFGIKGTI